MSAALFGVLCALSLGTADFMGRTSTRGLGAKRALLGMLLTSTLAVSLWIWLGDLPLLWQWQDLWMVALCGLSITVMTLLLYWGLARGPVSLVAPIVAAHPVLVLLFYVMVFGHRLDWVHWIAMAVTVIGTIVVAGTAQAPSKEAPSPDTVDQGPGGLKTTALIAVLCCLAYAVLVISGQSAAPIFGEIQTLWMARLVALATLALLFLLRRESPTTPIRWWPFLTAQGLLDATGYFALFAGAQGDHAGIAAVTASTFGVVTLLLAWIILRERITRPQWLGLALVFGGIAVLSY